MLRLRLAIGRCTKCSCKIPNADLSNSISGRWLMCKKCRNEGYYEGRCPVCNGGKRRIIMYRGYDFEEIQVMHKKCFLHLINDIKYQLEFGPPKYLIEKWDLTCASCGHYILRQNAQCPRCKRMRSTYQSKMSSMHSEQ
jgi:rubrerythrin